MNFRALSVWNLRDVFEIKRERRLGRLFDRGKKRNGGGDGGIEKKGIGTDRLLLYFKRKTIYDYFWEKNNNALFYYGSNFL